MQTTTNRAFDYKNLIISAISLGMVFIILLLSIIILIDPALGWFMNNKTTMANRAEVAVSPRDAHAEYACYVYNIRTSSVETTSISNLDMQPYDMIFDKRNRYTPAIFCVALSDIAPEYANGGTLTISIGRDMTNPNNTLDNHFSSIMRVTAVIGSNYYSSNADTLYSNIDAALYTTVKGYTENYSSASSKTFTTVTGGTGTDADPFTYSKADSISLTVPYTSSDKNGDILYLYLYLTYDEALVSKYKAVEGIDTSSATVGRTVTMSDDVETVEIIFS